MGMMDVKSILIDKELHKQLIEVKKETGIQIKHIVESAIKMYLPRIKPKKEED